MSTAEHYDRVTAVWQRFIMGDELHFGLFERPDEPLARATRRLTDRLIEAAELEPGHEVLDVGCGIGLPACRLALERDCRVVGISSSRVGVDAARARAAVLPPSVAPRFMLQDAAALRVGAIHSRPGPAELEPARFDRVFALESVHLINDKGALFRRWYELLRPGGRIALCDVTLVAKLERRLGEVESYRALGYSKSAAERVRAAVHGTLARAFGAPGLTDALDYRDAAEAAGFVDVKIDNLSSPTRPTLNQWAAQADRHAGEIVSELGERYLDDLLLALLHMSTGWGRVGGYVVMTAVRP